MEPDAPTPTDARENARLLGVDYDAVVAAQRSLVRWSSVLAGIPALALGMITGVVSALDPGSAGLAPALMAVLAGLLLAGAVVFVPMFVLSIVVALPGITRAPFFARQLVFSVAVEVAQVLGLWLVASHTAPAVHLGLFFCFAVFSCVATSLTGGSLVRLLKAQHPKLDEVVSHYRQLPAAMTVLNGDARWLIGSTAWGLVEAAGVALVVATAPELFAVVAVARGAASAVITWLLWKRGPRPALVVAAAASAVFLAAGIAAALVG